MHPSDRRRVVALALVTSTLCCGFPASSPGQQDALVIVPPVPSAAPAGARAAPTQRPEFPPYADAIKGYQKVISTTEGKSLYTIWIRKKDNQMLAELPSSYARQKLFIALTIASGERFAGLQEGDLYVYWRRYDKRLALIEPNVVTRSTGDAESRASVKRLFTDRVLLDVPILTLAPGGGPVIDMDALLVGRASSFFYAGVSNPRLATIKTAKAFPENVELAFEVPLYGGRLQTLHYSISVISPSTGYTPRKADERVGYFTTGYDDYGKYKPDETRTRNINRWRLEKADSSLALSPPKNPIIFYIEHTTPVRYRRWVEQGILFWNKAFETVGLHNAIKVEQQDARTGRHMEKDPEDVRYNFIRWLNNDVAMAIGPSRVNPVTGEILDADVILTDGWIRHFWREYKEILPQIVMDGFSPETYAWLETHPNWDPRIRLAPVAERNRLIAERVSRGISRFGGHPLASVDPKLIGDDEYDGLVGRTSQVNGLCLAARGKALDLALVRMTLEMLDDDKDKEEKKKEQELDGIPESFVGPLLADLVAHEVGHTLGLRHNFKASSVYSLDEINSDAIRGKKPLAGSVMDYLPVNMNMKDGNTQGDYGMIGLGPYDYWAIEYGYTFQSNLQPILDRVAERELCYATDEDTYGPDPLARRYDFGAEPLDYAESQMRLVKYHRERIVDRFVKKGDSWSKARQGYEMTLVLQTRAVRMMSNWLGGAFVHRDKKGDKNARSPVQVVDAEAQRKALKFVIENTFGDEVYGLTPALVNRMSVDKWLDGSYSSFMSEEATWPIHDRIMGIQASILTALMNPTTLRRVYDNEFRVPSDKDTITLPELLDTICAAIWTELDENPNASYTARKPLISSLRRNLQREHMERLIDLSLPGAGSSAAYKPISNLSTMKLREITGKIGALFARSDGGAKLDPYSRAHLTETKLRVEKALDAQYIYNADDLGGGSSSFLYLLKERRQEKPRD